MRKVALKKKTSIEPEMIEMVAAMIEIVAAIVILAVPMNRSETFELRKAEQDLLERTEMRMIIVKMDDGNKED